MTHMEVNFLETDSREFGLFLDGLRIERNMSREDLCEDIMSLSQYKRYLRGDTAIPNDRLVLIADKLKFSISDIHLMYRDKSDNQFNKINEVYTMIQSHNYNEAYTAAMKMRNDVFVSSFNMLYYDFCMIYLQHKLNMVSDVHVLELYSDLVDYPECASNNSFNWVEMNVLLQIINISSRIENYEPADLMYKILTSNDVSFSMSKNINLLPTIYVTLGQILGKQKKYPEVIEITNRGIEHCRKYEVFSALALLFLINSFANKDLGNEDVAIQSARNAFMQLYIENKPQKFEQFRYSFENKFNMSVDDLICL